jgi:hypothetical protein
VYSPDFALARTQPMIRFPDLVLDDGSFVLSFQTGVTSDLDYSLQTLAPDGTPLRSFGGDSAQYGRDRVLLKRRIVAKSQEGFWAIAPGRYALEQWDPASGRPFRVVEVRSDWFRQLETWPTDETQRPPAVITAMCEDVASGVVWVLLRDADLEWRPPPRAGVERAITSDEYARTYDWVLEAVDPASGNVVASKRFGHVLWARSSSNVLVSEREIEADGSVFDVWRPSLAPKGNVR